MVEVWIIVANAFEHELEVLRVDHVEADEGCEELYVEGCGVGSLEEEGCRGMGFGPCEDGFELVESVEDDESGVFVICLGGGEAGFVDPSVEVWAQASADFVDANTRIEGVEIQLPLWVFGGRKSSKAWQSICIMSSLSLLTICSVSVSQRTGTLYFPL